VISAEHRIENRIIRSLGQLGYRGSPWIRRAKICRGGFGTVDLMVLPESGSRRLVLVEVKQENSGDAAGKVMGQLLLYYVGSLRLGTKGLNLLHDFALTARAHDPTPKSLQMLSGGCRRGDDWDALQRGRKLRPDEVALIVGLQKEPDDSLLALRAWVKDHSGLNIGIVVAGGTGPLKEIKGTA